MARRLNWERQRIETRDRERPAARNGKLRKEWPEQNRDIPTPPSCPLCSLPMARRNGPSGPFWGCHQYPRCKGTRE
jgi:ssDNA-binding Zn-finger/Zn-ribbon topoisomerase 1